jgi:peptide deformylase
MEKIFLRKYGDPVLRQKCQPVKKIDEGTVKLIAEMGGIMIENQGVGIAAPQVGASKRIILIQTEEGPQSFVNPEILKKSKDFEIKEEGCLSVPGIRLNIRRAKEVLIKALDKEERPINIEARDLQARVFQHEIDHLNGILFIDRLDFFKRLKFVINPPKFNN